MEVIDILSPETANLPNFTVNTAVNFVNVVGIAGPGAVLHSCNGSFSSFARGDNFTILSCGIFIPERFTIYDYPPDALDYSAPIVSLSATLGGGVVPVLTFGNNGELKLPFMNYEFSIGVFTDVEKNGLVDPTFKLVTFFPLIANSLSISMVDVPAALNGIKFNVVPFFKVLHNFPLTV
ncbi:MAG: hypothetical protein WC390_11900 [Sulfurimonas sp.]|jgi:hypothetical protein